MPDHLAVRVKMAGLNVGCVTGGQTKMIENELKYVLRIALYDQVQIGMCPELEGIPEKMISQSYLTGGGRVRSTSGPQYLGEVLTFNYKHDLPSGESEEFEMEIDAETYERVCDVDHTLTKARYTYPIDQLCFWDVDFFINPANGMIYFAMAECEMPAGMDAPDVLPDFIRDNLIYAVPRDESSVYSSRKVADVVYATEQLRMLHHANHLGPSTGQPPRTNVVEPENH